jgi:hypothetical protein
MTAPFYQRSQYTQAKQRPPSFVTLVQIRGTAMLRRMMLDTSATAKITAAQKVSTQLRMAHDCYLMRCRP